MPYVITNGVNYVMSGADNRATTTGDISRARMFDSKVKAQNCCVCLPNALKKFGFYIQEVGAAAVGVPIQVTENSETRFANMPLFEDVPPADTLDERVLDKEFITKEMSRFEDFISLMHYSEPAVRQQLAHAEAQIFDIEHAAELEKLNVYQGFKVYKALHDARIMRRKCKDTLDIIERLNEVITDGLVGRTVSSHISTLENRTYTPRAIPELFEEIKRRTKE